MDVAPRCQQFVARERTVGNVTVSRVVNEPNFRNGHDHSASSSDGPCRHGFSKGFRLSGTSGNTAFWILLDKPFTEDGLKEALLEPIARMQVHPTTCQHYLVYACVHGNREDVIYPRLVHAFDERFGITVGQPADTTLTGVISVGLILS